MSENLSDYIPITRTFRDLSDVEVSDIGRASEALRVRWGGVEWDEILLSPRVLLISEAGAGKTRECQAQRDRLLAGGQTAFFFDLATLVALSPRDTLSCGEEYRFDAWLASQSEIATFFLDSIDELKITLGSFELALKRFAKALGGQLARAHIVITTRPIPFDRTLVERHLPIPSTIQAGPTPEAFADMVMGWSNKAEESNGQERVKAWRTVGLAPLSDEQRRLFAAGQGVSDPDAMMADIRARDAEEFAEWPKDLIEICADWRAHHRIRSHRDQVETNVRNKLKPRTDRREKAELTYEKAVEGASRLALAAMLTRKLTLRYNAESDRVKASEPALDVSKILLDWDAAAQTTLLERSLFGFASYGRVRFHHRTVVEFLAAKRLDALLKGGAPIKAVKRLLFTDTAQGLKVVRPSMRPIGAWLASWHTTIFDDLVLLDPAVVLNYGDPQALSVNQRTRALEAYVMRHGTGGWRGLNTPSIQVHRFATKELAGPITRLWADGIENGEVRELLLRLIAIGQLTECADIAYTVAMDGTSPVEERSLAIEALCRLRDARLDEVSSSLVSDAALWPPAVTRQISVELFPSHMPIDLFVSVIKRVTDDADGLGDYTYHLRRKIESADIEPDNLDILRRALTDFVTITLVWKNDAYPHIQTRRSDLLPALTAACCRQAVDGALTEAWLRSSLLALRLSKREYGDEKPLGQLRRVISELPSKTREIGFWHEVRLLEGLRPMKDTWNRLFELTHDSGLTLDPEKDAAWVFRRLADPGEPLEYRKMMLWAGLQLSQRDRDGYRVALENMKLLVQDAPTLLEVIDDRLAHREEDPEQLDRRLANAEREQQRDRQDADAHASWVAFWQEIVRDPDAVFHPDRANNTAWNLWRAVERSGKESRAMGWNRLLIEQQFGRAVADRLRETMKIAWRRDTPTLASERPQGEKNTFLVRWQFGLAGITAEAEDPNWATKLTESEAKLACRYVSMHLNVFPPWLDSLAAVHPAATDQILGEELSLALRDVDSGNDYDMTLEKVRHASDSLATLFIPRIRAWVGEVQTKRASSKSSNAEFRLRNAVEILIASGTDDDRHFVSLEAGRCLADGDESEIWLSALLQLSPADGVEVLERQLETAEVSQFGFGVKLFASLFDGDRGAGIKLAEEGFTPALLLRLLRLAYRHVRRSDDLHHTGSYTPNTRDFAEQARNSILRSVLESPGPEGWSVKLEMARDPLFAHLTSRTLAVAEEKAAEEADGIALSEGDFVLLDKCGEAAPATRDAMFALMRDRLEDLDDLLLQDISPRESWASITDEHVMRRSIAWALREASRGAYTVDQESVTADEKETDVRLRSTVSSQQGTIELKLADNRPGRDLFDTLRKQLLKKYMAAEDCRAGCLLVTIARERQWDHPMTSIRISFDELMRLLNDEAEAISRELGGSVKLFAKGLDLRARLGPK